MSFDMMRGISNQPDNSFKKKDTEKIGTKTLEVQICLECGEPVVFDGQNCGDFQDLVSRNPNRSDYKQLLDESRAIWDRDHGMVNEDRRPKNLCINVTEELNRSLNDAKDIGSIRPEKRDVPPTE